MSLRYKGGLISPSVNPLAANVTTSPNVAQYNGVFTLQQQGQALTSGQWATDPYYKNTTLLLHGDGKANGSQNNTFLDSSTNAFSITRNGNTTQGSFSPYGPTWSNYFDGSTATFYLTSSGSSTPFTFGTGTDFTFEGWFSLSTTTGDTDYRTIISNYGGGGGGAIIGMYLSGGLPKFRGLWGAADIIGTTTLTVGSWYHFAFCRSGTTFYLFLNGVLEGTATATTSADGSNDWFVGKIPAASQTGYFFGYISNVRVVKGAALYTSAFSPSTVPLTTSVSGGTVSLLTCQSNRFVDNGASTFSLVVSSPASVQRFSPFAPQYQYTPAVIGGSGYFDGSGDYLNAASNAAFGFGTGDFTMECWVYPVSWVGSYDGFISTLNSGTAIGVHISRDGVEVNGVSTTWGSALSLNTWTHLAVTRSGTSLKLFVNGAVSNTATNSANTGSASALAIGRRLEDYNGYYCNAYISNARVVKGTAVYTSAFTPPTTPLTAVSGTSLLANMTNAGIYDNAMMNDLETVGNAQVSTSVVKYGSGSLYFDGTGDALAIPTAAKTNFAFGTGNFTIEFWAWKSANGSGGYDNVISFGTSGNYIGGFCVELSSSRGFCVVYDSAVQIQANFNPNDATWHHYAVVRNGSTFALYKDGIQLTTATLTPTLGTTGTGFIGAGVTSSQVNFNGYIDDLRVTKGVARYTANFQPPKVAFANQ